VPACDGASCDGEAGEPSFDSSMTLVTEDSSSIGDEFLGEPRSGDRAAEASSGSMEAGIHSDMPGRQTSVEGGSKRLASAVRSSSVPTSR
jgi:hypothetical protein